MFWHAAQSLDLLVFISFLFLFVLLHFLLQRETMSDEPSGVVENDFCVFISSKLRRHLRNLEPKLRNELIRDLQESGQSAAVVNVFRQLCDTESLHQIVSSMMEITRIQITPSF